MPIGVALVGVAAQGSAIGLSHLSLERFQLLTAVDVALQAGGLIHERVVAGIVFGTHRALGLIGFFQDGARLRDELGTLDFQFTYGHWILQTL
jgi:hypothetical protein